MPMIATTIISSIRVKPCCTFLIGHSLVGHRYGSRTGFMQLSYQTKEPPKVSKAAQGTGPLADFCPWVPILVSHDFLLTPGESELLGLDVLAQAPLARHRLLGKDAAAPFAPQTGRCRAHPIELLAGIAAELEDEFLASLAIEPVLPDRSRIAQVVNADIPALLKWNEIARRRILQRAAVPSCWSGHGEFAKQRRRDVHLRCEAEFQ